MPTIDYRAYFPMVGTLRFAHDIPRSLEGAARDACIEERRSGCSTLSAEPQYAPFIGVQLNCGCSGAPCVVSAVLANGAGAIVCG